MAEQITENRAGEFSNSEKKFGFIWNLRKGLIESSFEKFFKKLSRGSFPLFAAMIAAIIWGNLSSDGYKTFWHTEISIAFGGLHIEKSLAHWIDEALMTLFFFLVGLEIKREILIGELASFKKALLPVAAAAGGMIVPAAIYAYFNSNTPAASGWGIPMATDIAFSLAVLAVLGRRVPFGIAVFLSAFAIADDLGAVLIIAVFYTETILWGYLLVAALFLCALFLANFLWIKKPLVYVFLGIGLWMAFLGSGIHATIAGVLVALCIPAKGKYDTTTFINNIRKHLNDFQCGSDECGYSILLNKEHLNAVHNIELSCHEVETPLQRFEYSLHIWVAFLILPLFALANSGIAFGQMDIGSALTDSIMYGIVLGLVLGKPIGIFLFTFLTAKLVNAPLMGGVKWRHILGASMLGGIGFTMSLFISGLSFPDGQMAEIAKLGIILGSLISGVMGIIVLSLSDKKERLSPAGAKAVGPV